MAFEISSRRDVAPNIHEIVIAAPAIARSARAGQFVIVMVDERAERVPYTLSDWDAERGTITLVVVEAGRSSRKLVLREAGSALAHVVGPLGEPLPIERVGTVAVAAGCYGIGAIVPIARALGEAGNRVVAIVEARSGDLHYGAEKLERVADELVQTTVDGSRGAKGHAAGVLGRRLAAGERFDRIIAVGCPFMMMRTGETTAPYGIETIVALNPIMVDGTGMCGACRVSVGGETKFACVDGPFFDAHAVDWDELWHRRAAYGAEEIEALEQTSPVVTAPRQA